MAYTLGNTCAKNCCKRTYHRRCGHMFFGTQCIHRIRRRCCGVNVAGSHHYNERRVDGHDVLCKHRGVRQVAGMESDRTVRRRHGNPWIPEDAEHLQRRAECTGAASQQFYRTRVPSHPVGHSITRRQRRHSRLFHYTAFFTVSALW